MESIFDRIDVVIAKHELTARPVDFKQDDDGNLIEILRYETTCPLCGCMVQFALSDAVIDDKRMFVECSECGAGKDHGVSIPVKSIIVAQVGQIVERSSGVVVPDRGCPFIDPIADGVFVLPQKKVFDRGGRNENNEGDLVDNSGGKQTSRASGAKGG